MRDYSLYLKDILAATQSIEEFVAGMSLETFKADDKTSSAVIRKLEVIGEASKQIPKATQDAFPGLPWKEMAGMRDRLIHFYFGVNHRLIWKTIKEDLPKVRAQIEDILERGG